MILRSFLLDTWMFGAVVLFVSSSLILRLANARLDGLNVAAYQISDFTATIATTSIGDFELRLSHSKQPNNILFSFSKYYSTNDRSGTKLPFLFVSDATLMKEPITDGHENLFLNDQKYNYFSDDVSIDDIEFSKELSCLNITGSVIFSNKKPRNNRNRNKNLVLSDIPYLLSLCLTTEPYYPYFHNDTAFHSKNSLNLDIQLFDNYENDPNNKQYNRIVFSYDVQSSDEGYFGFGEQYTYFNLRNKFIPILTAEQGVGRGLQPITGVLNRYYHGIGGYWHTTYGPKPMYMTNRNYSVLFENLDIMVFDVANSDPNLITVECFANDSTNHISAKIIFAETPLDMIEEITLITGRMKPLPKWVSQGHILGTEGGTHYVLNKTLTLVEDYGVKLAGIWLQDWVGMHTFDIDGDRLLWNWQLSTAQYPNWHEMVSMLRNDYDIRVLGYINPYFANVSHNQESDGSYTFRNYFEEGVNNGYFIKNASGDTYLQNSISIKMATVDLTNPYAIRWVKDIISKHMIQEAGLRGFMADFGEYTPFDCVLYDNQAVVESTDGQLVTPSTYHNFFPLKWAEVVSEAIEESGYKDEIVAFHRSSSLKSPKFTTAFWLGDQLVTWDSYDGLQSVLYGFFSSGLCGMTQLHSDTGGYTMINAVKWVFEYVRTQELMLRWIELNTFSDTMFRTHPGNRPNDSVQVFSDDTIIEHLRKFTNIFTDLAEYKYKLQMEAYLYGYPIVRHMYLHYYYDENVMNAVIADVNKTKMSEEQKIMNEQFMLGDCMLVAPVVRQGTYKKTVYLPKGTWISYWDENEVVQSEGEYKKFVAPLGKPPVFVCPEWEWGYHTVDSSTGGRRRKGWFTWNKVFGMMLALLLVGVGASQAQQFGK